MTEHCTYSDLNNTQVEQYKLAIQKGFPAIIMHSLPIKNCWAKLEEYFPEFQLFILGQNNEVIGFINTVPIFWDKPLNELPNNGWDWLLTKGISDYEENIKPNSLGGLQVVIPKEHQGKGLSQTLIAKSKNLIKTLGFRNLIIPIRPIFKHKHPHMSMNEYMNLKEDNKIYDPWIRTHLKSGATIINVCKNSMNISGDLIFWQKLINEPLTKSGHYLVDGALNPVYVDIDKNHGEYREENIWINYPAI